MQNINGVAAYIGNATQKRFALMVFFRAGQCQAELAVERLIRKSGFFQPVRQFLFKCGQRVWGQAWGADKYARRVGNILVDRLQLGPAEAGRQFEHAQVGQLLIQNGRALGIKNVAVEFEAFDVDFFSGHRLANTPAPGSGK